MKEMTKSESRVMGRQGRPKAGAAYLPQTLSGSPDMRKLTTPGTPPETWCDLRQIWTET